MFKDQIRKNIEVYIDDILVKFRRYCEGYGGDIFHVANVWVKLDMITLDPARARTGLTGQLSIDLGY